MRGPRLRAVTALLLLVGGPLLGLGGQARAGFVVTSVDGAETREAPRWTSIARDFLRNANPPADLLVAGSSSPATEEPLSPVPGPRDLADTSGAGSPHSEPAGPAGSVTLPVSLSGPPVLPTLPQGGVLSLAELRPCPHDLASRLFRPPRC